MNRRSFIQAAIGSALTVMGFQSLAWGIAETTENESLEVKDLIMWAPFEPLCRRTRRTLFRIPTMALRPES